MAIHMATYMKLKKKFIVFIQNSLNFKPYVNKSIIKHFHKPDIVAKVFSYDVHYTN